VSRNRSCWRAPGRVNLIGEHTDYNAGYALPFAIDKGCVAAVQRAGGDEVLAVSRQRPDPVSAPLAALRDGPSGWAGYIFGVVWALQQLGVPVPALVIDVDSSVPDGAGLSSSAALVCSVAAAIDDLLGLDLSADALLAITRSAENDFVGAPTGGLDQLAALNCTAEHALLCDMRNLSVRQVPFDLDAAGLALLVIDTGAQHRHATGEYGARRAGCEEAARRLGVVALRDVPMTELDAALRRLDDARLRRYVRHVVTENDRVLRTVALLDRAELAAIGPLLTGSHESLRDEYRVTIDELDVAAAIALDAGALGARMTGGGFGGSVIALVAGEEVTGCADAVTAAFAARGFAAPATFLARAMPGVHPVD
jgi:galactokinase